MEKPNCKDTMLLSTLNKNKDTNTYVIPLLTLHRYEDEDKIKITLDMKLDMISKDTNKIVITISDDPMMEWAGDYINLGCNTIRYALNNVSITFIKGKTIFKGILKDFKQTYNFCGRTIEDENSQLLVP